MTKDCDHWLLLENSRDYHARQARITRKILPYWVDFKAPGVVIWGCCWGWGCMFVCVCGGGGGCCCGGGGGGVCVCVCVWGGGGVLGTK